MEIHDSRPVDYRWHIMMMTGEISRLLGDKELEFRTHAPVTHLIV